MVDEYYIHLFRTWMSDHRLLCLDMLLHKAGRKSVFGCLVDYDEQSILFYDVDRSQTLHVAFNQIDDIQPARKVVN